MAPYANIDDEGIRQHHGNITQLDHAFGMLMKGLDEMGLRDNTIVFFTSDNGPEGATADPAAPAGRPAACVAANATATRAASAWPAWSAGPGKSNPAPSATCP